MASVLPPRMRRGRILPPKRIRSRPILLSPAARGRAPLSFRRGRIWGGAEYGFRDSCPRISWCAAFVKTRWSWTCCSENIPVLSGPKLHRMARAKAQHSKKENNLLWVCL